MSGLSSSNGLLMLRTMKTDDILALCIWIIFVSCVLTFVPCLVYWGLLEGFIRWSVVAGPLFALGYLIQCVLRNRNRQD